ncbi:MAG TPA: ATP-binding protein [Chitinophaga sp.]|uniref:sensor histidine kinase n=1 Tax=Chitinophaga sp. TaxID=1869181 RepID=UPI002B5333CE|nr:ATP-binding protein [Chitinophaga sp.]HVI45858.1 ATP-binding protein [Chitinophaga sp.]
MPAVFNPSEDTTAHYFIKHFTDDDGLPQNSVKGIVPDRNGFLWLPTENGLARFDGSYFLNFGSNNLPDLKSSRMARVYPNDTAIAVETDIGEILTVTGSTVTHIGKELPGYKYQQYKDRKDDYYPIRGWPDDYAAHFAKIRPIVMPQGTDSYFSVHNDTISLVKRGKVEYRIIQPQLDLLRLFVCGNQLFYLNRDGKLLGWERDRPVKVSLTGALLSDPAFNTCRIELFWNLAARQVFVYTNGNCYILQPEQGGIRSDMVLRDFDFHQTYITSIYYDQLNRRVFLGSSTKGLYVCTRQQFEVHKSDVAGMEVFYAQAPFPGNTVVTASGIAFNRNGQYRWLPLSLNRESPLEKYTLARDQQGRYWGRYGRMLIGISPDFSKVLRKVELPFLIGQTYTDREGNVWVGGKYRGLYYIKTADPDQTLRFLPAALNDVTYIKEGQSPGGLWVGTVNGLYRVHLPSGHTDTIRGLEQGNIRSIYVPKQGEVWITTYNRGVFLYRNERLVSLPLDGQRYMSTTHCITEDSNGYLWLTTNKGLFSVRRQDALDFADGKQHDVFYYYFGKDQGFNSNEFNGGCEPCAFQFDDGDISLPSLDGLVQFTPAAIRMEMPDKEIFVDWVERDLKLTEAAERFELPNNFKTFRLHVSSPYFGDARNLYFYYCLEKDDWRGEQIWLPVNSDRTITLSSLPSGHYRIRIRKLKGFGRDQYIEKVITILVQDAFYEKGWFRLVVLFALICLIMALYKIRVRHIQRQNRLLEINVGSRTRKLEETMTILRESDQQLRRQSLMHKRLLTAITHDIKTPLKFLLRVNKKNEALSGRLQEEEIKTVTYDSLYRMHHLVDNLIHYMRTSFLTGEFSKETVDLFQLIEEKMEIFKPVSDSKEVQIINNILPGTTVVINKLLLAVVLHNLLDNAVKYTANGVIEVTTERNERSLIIHVSDTGYGMPPVIRDWINRTDNDTAGHSEGTGIGLILVMELLTVINGRLFAAPGTSVGTRISLLLYFNNE